ncbi:MAG: hypothetical protein AB1861_21690 [Cyanobacteriota bacterium]
MTEIPIACTLNKNEFGKRHNKLNTLRQLVREMRQTLDEFTLRFDSSTENWMAIAHVVAQERLCCPFLEFQLTAEKGMGSFWLEVTGENDSAQFLMTMFGFDSKEGCSASCTSPNC